MVIKCKMYHVSLCVIYLGPCRHDHRFKPICRICIHPNSIYCLLCAMQMHKRSKQIELVSCVHTSKYKLDTPSGVRVLCLHTCTGWLTETKHGTCWKQKPLLGKVDHHNGFRSILNLNYNRSALFSTHDLLCQLWCVETAQSQVPCNYLD